MLIADLVLTFTCEIHKLFKPSSTSSNTGLFHLSLHFIDSISFYLVFHSNLLAIPLEKSAFKDPYNVISHGLVAIVYDFTMSRTMCMCDSLGAHVYVKLGRTMGFHWGES